MKTRIAYLLFLFVITACSPLILKLNGVRKPRVETVESIQKKLCSYDPEYAAYLCIPKDSAGFLGLLGEMEGLPSNSIYLASGSRVRFIDSSYCAGTALNFAQKLNRDSTYALYPGRTFSSLRPFLIPIGGKVDLNTQSYDYTVVFYWTNFLGRGNHNVFMIARELKESYKGPLNFVFINMDIQESWKMKGMPYKVFEPE